MKKILTLLVFIAGTLGWAYALDTDVSKLQYTGKYKFSEDTNIPVAEVLIQDNALVLSSSMGTATLHQLQGDVFCIEELHGTAEFVRGADKKIKSIIIKMKTFEIEGAKEPSKKSMLYHPLCPQKFLAFNERPIVT